MTYKHLKPWKRPDSYAGPEWTGYYVVIGQHRDSDSISRSNWIVAGKRLGNEAERLGDAMLDSEGESFLQIVRDHHWAAGWVEFLYLHKDAPPSILQLAEEINAKIDDYPVLDDDHHSELEYSEAADYWARLSVRDRGELIIESKCGASLFAARHDYLPSDDNGALFERLRD